ncbi:helix-turn-helix domain-containing protein, partial [Pseudomonas syringae]
TMGKIAVYMQLTTRTQRRKLQAVDTDYGAILEDDRSSLAIENLQQKKMSTEYIAAKLGFSARTNLRRACKRRTRHTPRQLRD